jgi:dTDP-4-amino-4,6-dideoxygalactose transaminase
MNDTSDSGPISRPLIPFNVPVVLGDEANRARAAIDSRRLSGGGPMTRRAAERIEQKVGCRKVVLTSSCTDALEMCALLADIGPEDEVVMPSFTFVSTASAFALRGARIVWCDIRPDTKNLDERLLPGLITERTKVVVVVHYGGVGCEMDEVVRLCRERGILLVEDAAQAVDCTYRGRPLGSIGDLGTYSFHDTKNIQCGEGGALLVNSPELVERAEILRDKGTDRSRFLRGLVDKYTWVALGSSFLMSELQAAFLSVQLESSERINARRRAIWRRYHDALFAALPAEMLPAVPQYCVHNGHMFYVQLVDLEGREALAGFLRERGISTAFHYVPLHEAPYWEGRYRELDLPVTRRVSDGLLRLPMFFDLTDGQVDEVCGAVVEFAREKGIAR